MNISSKSRQILVLIVLVSILILAFFLRFNASSADLIDSDSYYHARMVQYLLEDNALPKTDPLAYYQVEGGTPIVDAGLLWITTAIIYKLIYFGEVFDKSSLYSLLIVLPIIFGLISVLLIYFIGNELYGKKVGLAASFCAAILPSLIYRTSGGFFEDENIGMILMLASFLFYFKFLKETDSKKKIVFILLSGVIIALMSLTWKVYILIPMVILAHICIGQIFTALKEGPIKKIKLELVNYTINCLLLLIAISFGPFVLNQNLFEDISYYLMIGGVMISESMILVFFILAVVVSTLISLFIINKNYLFKENIFKLVPFALYGLGLVLGFVLFFIVNKSLSSIHMFISEEVPGTLFLLNQNGLILFLVALSLLLLPFTIKIGLKDNSKKLFLFLLLIAATLMSIYQVKYVLLFGLIAPLGVAFLINELINIRKGNIKFNLFNVKFLFKNEVLKKGLFGLFFLMLIATLFYSVNVTSNIESVTLKLFGVKEASVWLNVNSVEGAKVFSWWDAGHLITFFSERKVVCDNRNYFGPLSEVNKDVAEFFLTSDVNKGLKIINSYGANYLIIYPQLFVQGRVLKAYSFDSKTALDSNFNYNYYGLCERIDQNIICDGRVLVDYRSSKSDYWMSYPNASIDGEDYYFYLGEDFYFMLDEETNNSNLAKIYFESEDTINDYEKIYSYFGTRIFKLKE